MKKKAFLWCLAAMFSGTALADSHAQPTVYGRYFAMEVSDPGAVVAAMQKYWGSATGKKLTGNATLSAVVANGREAASHTVSVFYESAAAMAADMQTASGSNDAKEFVAAMSKAMTLEAENVFTMTKMKINAEGLGGAGTANMLYGMTVTDRTRFNTAINAIFESKAAAAFPGNILMGEILAMGDTPGTHWVSFQSKDMATLLNGVEAFMKSADFARYARYASEFRNIESCYISSAVLDNSE
ncbi:MAG: hypothetical protein AAGG11_08005 [Pseudomonadota bacterium]